jgi:hypothetical protein
MAALGALWLGSTVWLWLGGRLGCRRRVCSFSLTKSYFAELTDHLSDENLQVELMQDSPAMGCLVRVRVAKL